MADEGTAAARLEALLARANEERAILDFPDRPWVVPHHTEDGRRILNVLVVGAGQAGISILSMLARDHVDGAHTLSGRHELARQRESGAFGRLERGAN